MQAGALELTLHAGQKVHLADRCGRGKGLAAEAEGPDRLEILLPAQLGGRMAEEGRLRVLPDHAAAVVGDAQEGHAAVLDLDGDHPRTGVNGIFNELLGHGGRALHDLAGGNQIRHMGIELNDLCQGDSSFLRFSIESLPGAAEQRR